MNNIIRFASFMICILALQSCVKDLQDDVNNGGWNHERSVIGIEFENQIGAAKSHVGNPISRQKHQSNRE